LKPIRPRTFVSTSPFALTFLAKDGVILDYKGRRLVGVTILDASRR
jgi:hypothetical protein